MTEPRQIWHFMIIHVNKEHWNLFSSVCVRHYCSSRELPVLFHWRVKKSLQSAKVQYSTYVSLRDTDLGQGSHFFFFFLGQKVKRNTSVNAIHPTVRYMWQMTLHVFHDEDEDRGRRERVCSMLPQCVCISEERSSQRSSSSKSVFWVHLNRTLCSKLILGTDAAGKTIALYGPLEACQHLDNPIHSEQSQLQAWRFKV